MLLLLRSVLAAAVLPGTVTLLIPWLIVSRSGTAPLRDWGAVQALALVPIVIGVSILVRCIYEFAARGRGTLAPVDPPKHLVVSGLYRYVRNPMYLGALIMLLGEAALFRSTTILVFAAVWFLLVNLFVLFYEEPILRRRFGESYDRYRGAVHRWLPGKPYEGS